MRDERPSPRYEMVNVRTGYIVVEHELKSKAMRCWFSAEPSPPVEEYREGASIWKFSATAQSFRFDILERETGEVTPFDELLGLVFWGSCRRDGDVWRIGELAQENRISLYIAVTFEAAGGKRIDLGANKLGILNRYYNERLSDPTKKILILPDTFDLYREFSYGQVMVDLGLTAME